MAQMYNQQGESCKCRFGNDDISCTEGYGINSEPFLGSQRVISFKKYLLNRLFHKQGNNEYVHSNDDTTTSYYKEAQILFK